MNTLLVVEDEVITSDLLRRYFQIVGYEVINALTGADAVKMAIEKKPRIVILDIMLPDMDGYEVCKKLRADERTKHIPIIFLTQKDDRRDRLDGLELGADDYITKPFDVEELRLRVHNILGRSGGTPLVDPRTSLPNLALLQDRLPRLVGDPESLFIEARLAHFEEFSKQYGPVAANQVIRSSAKIIGDILHAVDPAKTFIGHPHDDRFLLVVPRSQGDRVEIDLTERLNKQIKTFYDYPDQKRGKMKMGDDLIPFMAFALTRVDASALKALLGQARPGTSVPLSKAVPVLPEKASDGKKQDEPKKPEAEGKESPAPVAEKKPQEKAVTRPEAKAGEKDADEKQAPPDKKPDPVKKDEEAQKAAEKTPPADKANLSIVPPKSQPPAGKPGTRPQPRPPERPKPPATILKFPESRGNGKDVGDEGKAEDKKKPKDPGEN